MTRFFEAERSWRETDPRDIALVRAAPTPLTVAALQRMLDQWSVATEISDDRHFSGVQFSVAGDEFVLWLDKRDPNYVLLVMVARDLEERTSDEMLARCNRLNRQRRMARAYWSTDEKTFTVSVEFLAQSVEDIERNIIRYIESACQMARAVAN